MKKHLYLSLLLAILLLSACAPRPPAAPAPAPPTAASATAAPSPTSAPTATSLPSPSPSAAPPVQALDPILAQLRSATYPVEMAQSGSVTLVDGEYREQAAPDSAAEMVARLFDAAVGDPGAQGAPAAAAVLTVDGGGSGLFYYLYPVVEENGALRILPPVLLGDRIRLLGLEIAGKTISARALTAEDGDPLCCPTHLTTLTYTLEGQTLKGPKQSEQKVDLLAPGLLNVTWQWRSLEGAEELTIERGADYTLRFLPDGSYEVRADCNRGGGRYLANGKILLLLPGALTSAACPPDSLDARFLSLLGEARVFKVQEGLLTLTLKLEQGRMTFRAQ